MDEYLYPVSLAIIVALAFMFYRGEKNFSLLIVLLIGAYLVYSHETGNTATDLKNEIIKSVDEAVGK